MQADREHPRVVVEDGLHTIAVMHVHVHVGDPLAAGIQQPADGDRQIVVDAEAAGVIGHRVMQPAADVAGSLDLTAPDSAGSLEVAMATRPAISCMPAKAGLSDVPIPYAAFGSPRRTASM